MTTEYLQRDFLEHWSLDQHAYPLSIIGLHCWFRLSQKKLKLQSKELEHLLPSAYPWHLCALHFLYPVLHSYTALIPSHISPGYCTARGKNSKPVVFILHIPLSSVLADFELTLVVTTWQYCLLVAINWLRLNFDLLSQVFGMNSAEEFEVCTRHGRVRL